MSRYLSPEWLDELAAAVGDVELDDAADPVRLVIEQRVTGTPGGDVVYRLVVAGGQVALTAGPSSDADADVTLTQDVATASAVARGEVNPLEAVQAGRIRIAGDAGRLRAATGVLRAVAVASARLRATTDHAS